MNKHDFFNPVCPKNDPVQVWAHSNGTIYYQCKNCAHCGTLGSFISPFPISEIVSELQNTK